MSIDSRLPAPIGLPLAGRQRELTLAAARFESAAAGRFHVLLVSGEPGIGKTRLLEETAAQVRRTNAVTVLRGGASEAAGMPPYLPFLEAFGSYIRSTGLEALRAAAGDHAPILAPVFPEVVQRLGEQPSPYQLLPEQAKLRLFTSAGLFLSAIAREQPVLLLLDDLQWADAATLDMLCHIASRQPTTRALVMGAYREGETAANPALMRAVNDLNRGRLLTTIALAPLAEGEIAALAGDYLGGAIDEAIGRLLYAHSEGNPFFAEELLRSWAESGGVVRHGESWTVMPSLDPGRIPPGITGTINQRLLRLSAGTVTLLEIAAVIGKSFSPAMIAELAGPPPEAVDSGLAAAARAGLIHAEPAGGFTFGHDKIRETLYAGLLAGRRQRLHGAVGLMLESRRSGPGAHGLASLAFHFVQGGDRERGAMYSARAAEKALADHAPAEALAHYRAALASLSADDARYGDWLLGVARSARLTEALAESADAYEAAYAWFRKRNDWRMASGAARGLGAVRERLAQLGAAREAREVAVALTEQRDGPEAVYALAELAEFEPFIGQYREGLAHAEEAARRARAHGDVLLQVKVLRALGRVLTRMNNTPAGVRVLEQALDLAQRADDPVEAASCCYRLEYAAMNIGRLKRCRELCLMRMRLARRSHDVFELCHAEAWLAYVAALQGEWSEVEQLISSVGPAAERLTNFEPLSFVLKAAGFMAYQRAEFEVAEERLLALEALFRRTPEAVGRYRGGLLGLAHLRAAHRERAAAYSAEYETLLSTLPEGSTPTAPILTTLAMTALAMDDRERALGWYVRLLPFEGQHYWFLVDRVLAALEVLRGDLPAAEAHLDAAEAHAREEHLRPELPLVMAGRADLELARGGPGSTIRARGFFAKALRLLEDAGMAAEASRVRELLRALPPQPGARPAQAYPAGLSGREVEVLRLVVAGLSNREIARKLALSEKTVANHLTAILNKTGTDNRTAATTFAIRQGLA